MASLIFKVLSEKSKYKNGIRQEQKQKIEELKTESIYAYKLKQEFKTQLDKYIDGDDVKSVRIIVPMKYITIYLKVIFREEFTEYNIMQVGEREFEISRKEILI